MSRRRLHRYALSVAAAVAVLAVAAGAAPARQVPVALAEGGTERVELRDFDGVAYLRLSDLARVARAPRHWNAGNRKMTLCVGGHRLSVSPGNAFVKYDARVRNLHHPVRVSDGDFWVPEAFLAEALGPAAGLAFDWAGDPSGLRVTVRAAFVDSVRLDESPEATTVVILVSRLPEFSVAATASDEITLRLEGAALRDTLEPFGPRGLVTSVAADSVPSGLSVKVGVSGAATAFTAEGYHSPARIELRIEGGRAGGLPDPRLREERHVATPVVPFAASGGDVETVMIDAAHGGRDRGGVGPTGVVEKDVALAVARKLSQALQERGFYVFMTRNSDFFVPVKRRAEIANLADADVLVSIQCDASHSGSASGATVLYFDPPEEEESRFFGRERSGLRFVPPGGGSEAADRLLWKRMQERHIGESRALARTVRSALRDEMPDRDRGVAGRDLALLSGCAMPAIVVEMGFITNRDDVALLADESFQNRMAALIARAIDEYGRSFERRDQ